MARGGVRMIERDRDQEDGEGKGILKTEEK